MPSNYEAIREDNRRKYGTDIGRIGPMLLAHRYADRTHFIFELLQNAEDALGRRRQGWRGPRAVTFTLERDVLRVSHFGEPFNENDVRGICGIAESTKEDASGTSSCAKAGLGLFTVRAQSHAITVSFLPTSGFKSGRSFAISAVTSIFGYKCPIRFSASSRIHWP